VVDRGLALVPVPATVDEVPALCELPKACMSEFSSEMMP
jgi:hypothetical protein